MKHAAIMKITRSAILQVLAFSMATLLATGILVWAGLNENAAAQGGLASISILAKEPR